MPDPAPPRKIIPVAVLGDVLPCRAMPRHILPCHALRKLFDHLLYTAPVSHRRSLAVPSRSPIPSPSQLLGRAALAIVRQVGLADCSGCCAVGHVLMAVMAPGESVHIDHNGLVNLEASNGSALVTDG